MVIIMSYTSTASYALMAFVLLYHLSNIQPTSTCKGYKCVDVDIYYESLCPDSVKFIREQLAPSYLNLEYYLNLTFIPYGKGTHVRNAYGKWIFTCQHGPDECEKNKGQVCGLEVIEKFTPSEQKNKLKVDFVDCVMREDFQEFNNTPMHCATILLDRESQSHMHNCINSEEGDELLASYGDRTNNFLPLIAWVPTIVINKAYSHREQLRARTDFRTLICEHLTDCDNKPIACE